VQIVLKLDFIQVWSIACIKLMIVSNSALGKYLSEEVFMENKIINEHELFQPIIKIFCILIFC
jgi:hypothetical protein